MCKIAPELPDFFSGTFSQHKALEFYVENQVSLAKNDKLHIELQDFVTGKCVLIWYRKIQHSFEPAPISEKILSLNVELRKS